MSLTDLESHALAYYTSGQAKDLNIATRWYPYGELILIIEDKISIATRKFGFKVRSCSKAAGTAFLDMMIEKGGWATKQNEFGGAMHQFQSDVFPQALAEFNATSPIVQAAAAGDENFWADKFAELTAS